jgi:aspartate/methionine/tyrosine aminotransferase
MFKPAKNNQVLNPNNEILVTTGACEGLFAALHHLVEHGDEVLTFEPYYTSYVNYVEYAGAKLKTVPFKVSGGKWEYDFDAFERAITPKTKVVMLINPHNPTGKIFTRSELEKLTLIIEKHP